MTLGITKTFHFPLQCNGNLRVRQGMILLHSGVMDTVFHTSDAWDSMP